MQTMNTQAPPTQDRVHILATHHRGAVSSVEVVLPESAWMGSALVGMTPEAAVEHARTHAPISSRAHAKAVELACTAALGAPLPDRDESLATERWLAAEVIDAHLHRLLLAWPTLLGFEPRHNRYTEFHRRLMHCADAETASALGGDVLDLVARELLAGFFSRIRMPHGIGEFLDRLEAGGSLSSVMAALIGLGAANPAKGDKVPLLGTLSAAAWATSAGHWPAEDFMRQPTQGSVAAETGALARHAASQLVKLLLDRGHRVSARLFARAIDLADCASRMRHPESEEVAPLIDATAPEPGIGLARVTGARGVLLCWAKVADGLITDCVMVPPEAWNFHPEGPFCREAVSTLEHPEDEEACRKRLAMLALALDPAREIEVEFTGKAPARKRK